jgi:hypothetical protein
MRYLYWLLLLLFITKLTAQTTDTLPPWQEGYLDIHHINTGRGNAAFFLLPDGTTMLFDAGDLEVEGFVKKNAPLKVTAAWPNDSLSAGQWIVHYIRQVLPRYLPQQIDYALISHFHGDHYGVITERSTTSATGPYKLSGVTEVAEYLPVKCLIDRGTDFPFDLAKYYSNNPTFSNYLSFAAWQQKEKGMVWQPLQAGSRSQLQLTHKPAQYPDFYIRNVKANGTIWTGKGGQVTDHLKAGQVLDSKGGFNENPLSLAIKLSYGLFDYYTGGDNTGLQGYGMPAWFDVETPMARAVGRVEALTLDHHGNRDATNENFLKGLRPKVIVQQVWCSDHPGQEVLHRMIAPDLYPGSRDLFATNMHEETKVYMGPWLTKNYKSMLGHVLIRVSPGGRDFKVYVLEYRQQQLQVVKVHGPYSCE